MFWTEQTPECLATRGSGSAQVELSGSHSVKSESPSALFQAGFCMSRSKTGEEQGRAASAIPVGSFLSTVSIQHCNDYASAYGHISSNLHQSLRSQ